MKVKELLKSSDNWCQDNYALDKNNNPVGIDSNEACRWCLTGAINRCYGYGRDLNALELIKKRLRLFTTVANWNDEEDRTFQQVKSLVEELDI